MKKLTKGQTEALLIASKYYVEMWPNEACIPQLDVAVEKLRDGLRGRVEQAARRDRKRRDGEGPLGRNRFKPIPGDDRLT